MASSESESKPYIIIFKAPSDSDNDTKDAYYEEMVSAGFQTTLVPVLDFEFCNLDELLTKIRNPNAYSGIIFTSPRCVHGLRLAVKDDEQVLKSWIKHKHFVVGESTSKLVEEFGFATYGSESGNANALADVIVKDKYEKPLLYPMGSLTQKNFKLKLKESGVETDDIVIYKTKPHDLIKSALKEIIGKLKTKTYFVYFSPSGVSFTLPILKDLQVDVNKIKFVAIGPSTEAALTENGLIVAGTSSKPNPANLLETIKRIEKDS